VLPIAISDREGAVELILDGNDSGGTHIDKPDARGGKEAVSVTVPCRTLLAILAESGVAKIDALKIDVEGAEDLVLVPFLRDAPRELWPALILIEDTRGFWQTDVFALLEQHGYTVAARNRQNVAYRRGY
jgi:FkbM family methyltransferase